MGGLLFFIFVLVPLYFLPTIIAYYRDHHQFTAIFLTNLIFGWTFIGWGVALIWSAMAVRDET